MTQEPATQEIPDKLFFRIGEVSKLLGVPAYVLRFWESEFALLSPKKSDTGHRQFRRKDVELLFRIKELLYDKRFTLEGARQTLKEARKHTVAAPEGQQNLFAIDPLPQIREELVSLLELLNR